LFLKLKDVCFAPISAVLFEIFLASVAICR